MPRTKAQSAPSPRERDAKPVGDAADGSSSSSATTLVRNVVLAAEEVGDGEGAGEGADDDWQSTDVKGLLLLLSWEVTAVERLATTARRTRRARPWRRLAEDDDGMSGVRARREVAIEL